MTDQTSEAKPIHEVLHPSHWKKASGYANGISAATGRTLYLGGQIGWTADQVFESDDFIDQTRQVLTNIVELLAEAGAEPRHLTRLTWFVTDKRLYLDRLREVGAAYRDTLGRHFPAMTMVQVAALVEDRALVEIEATAVLPD